MARRQLRGLVSMVVLASVSVTCWAGEAGVSKKQFQELKEQFIAMQRDMAKIKNQHETEVRALKADRERQADQIAALQQQVSGAGVPSMGAAEAKMTQLPGLRPLSTGGPLTARKASGLLQSLNPDMSVVIDTYYHQDDAEHGIQEILEDVSGFGHGHGEEDEHGHAGIEDGFNLREVELVFSAEVDPYFKGEAIIGVSEHGAEVEEATIETTSLPYGFKLMGGKFFSDIGRVNAQHSHAWDFVDQPLIYALTLGDHGLNEKGLQLSWLAPTPFYMLAGAEVLQGENEDLFATVDNEHLPDHDGPRLWTGWLKIAPNLPDRHGLQFGFFGGHGNHQEAHDEDEDGTEDHWFDGFTAFWGADLVYKYDSPKAHGHGDFILQAEYFNQFTDMRVEMHDLEPDVIGNNAKDKQDGYYVQALYGFMPRWRAGVRWDHVGLTNESRNPEGEIQDFDSSHRLSAMVDYTLSEFSRLRLQYSQGEYETDEGERDVSELFLQWTITFGSHGAHDF